MDLWWSGANQAVGDMKMRNDSGIRANIIKNRRRIPEGICRKET